MNLYTFTLERFHVDNTRSRHEDTDTVAFGLQIGNQQFPVQSFFAGDVNNGDHAVNLRFASVLISESTMPVVISYQIYNGDASKLQRSLSALNADLANKAIESMMQQKTEQGSPSDYTDFPDNGQPDTPDLDFSDPSWLLFLEFVTIGSFLFPDCDGFVAVGTIGKAKNTLDTLIDSAVGNTYRHSIRYPGGDSPAGCGSNSDYTVTWSVTRERIIGSLRQFLNTHHLTLHPGIRSLSTSAVLG
jgi:hypothetical protein